MDIKPETRESLKFIAGGVCLVGAMIISFIALFLPPQGVIDSSVLWLIAQVLVFISSLWHIGDFISYQTKKLCAINTDKKEGI